MRVALVFLLLCVGCTFEMTRVLDWADLRGTVVFTDDAQQAVLVRDARVSIEGSGLSVRSDAKGLFVLRGLPAGNHVLLVSHLGDDGVERGARLRVQIDASSQGAGDGRDLGRVSIGRLGSLTGTVIWEGEAAADVRVALNSLDAQVTDEEGAFRHEKLLPGVYSLSAVRVVGGLVQSAEHADVEVLPGQSTTTSLVLTKVEGSAVVSGVALVAGQRTHTGISIDFLSSTGATYSTETDEQGQYFDTLPVGEYRVVAQTSGYLPATLPWLALTRDVEAPTLVLVPCPESGCTEELPDDADGDGILDADDNCVEVANRWQEDWNTNGVGDACDDSDEDGVADDVDNCRDFPNPDQADWNTNGRGDACEDSDNDGARDSVDNCLEVANSHQGDHDRDGVGNACDTASGLCGDLWCFDFPTPGPSDAVAFEASASGDRWATYGKHVETWTSQGWSNTLAIETMFNGVGDDVGSLQAIEIVSDDEVYVGGSDGLLARYLNGQWSLTVSPGVDTVTLNSMRGAVYSSSPYGHHRLDWPDAVSFLELDPQSMITGIATLPSGTTYVVHNLGAPYVTLDAITFIPINPSLDLTRWYVGGGALVFGHEALLFGSGDGSAFVLQLIEAEGGVTDFRQFELPGLVTVHGAVGAAANDVWVYGDNRDGHPVLMHFDGNDWLRHPLGYEPPGDTPTRIVGVSVLPSGHVDVMFSTGVLLSYDGDSWQSADGVALAPKTSVAAVGPQQAWATDSMGGLHRWDPERGAGVVLATGGWVSYPTPTTASLSKVVAVGPDDVWALGEQDLLRFDGTAWVPAFQMLMAPDDRWAGAWVAAADDLWFWSRDLLTRFDGASFNTMPLPGGTAVEAMGGRPDTGYWAISESTLYEWNDVGQTWDAGTFIGSDFDPGVTRFMFVVRGPDDVDLLGDDGNCLRYDGSTWTPAGSMLPGNPGARLNAIWSSDNGMTYGVTSSGRLLERATTSTAPFVSRYSLASTGLTDLSGFGDELWAVGGQAVYRSPTIGIREDHWLHHDQLTALWLSADETRGVAASRELKTLNKDREGWQPIDQATSQLPEFTTIVGTSVDLLLAVAVNGEVMTSPYATAWESDPQAPAGAIDAWADKYAAAWLITDTGIHRYEEQTWTLAHTPSETSGLRVVTGDANRVFVAGASGMIVFDGSTWAFENTPGPLIAASVAEDTGDLFALVESDYVNLHRRSAAGAWSQVPIASPRFHECNRPTVVSARTATDVWVSAPIGDVSTGACPPFVGRFDGTAWHTETKLPPLQIFDFVRTEKGLWGIGAGSAILKLRVVE